MRYHTTDPYGVTHIEPDVARMWRVLELLEHAEEADHPDASLVHESGWSLTVTAGGTVVLENLEDESEPSRLRLGVEKRDALRLWERLAAGDVEGLQDEAWDEV